MKVPGIRWLAGSAVTAVALLGAADAASAASHIDISTTCEGVTLSVRGARWIQQIDVEVDGEIVYRKVFFGQIEDREPISRGS